MKQPVKEVSDLFFEGIPQGGDVLLLVSPLVWTGTPILGLHLLQAACRRAGVSTHTFYSNLLFSTITGQHLHSKISLEEYLFLGERLFAPAAFNGNGVSGCKDKFSDPTWMPEHAWGINPHMTNLQVPGVLAPFREWIGTVDWKHLENLATHWIQTLAQRIARMGNRIVGCSTTFGGLVPAIALLDNIKKENPNIITVIGGALCEEEMAQGILSLNAGIDYVFSGEGEMTFPGFVRQVLAGHLPEEQIIHGEQVKNLDALPFPDYYEFFEQLEKLPSQNRPSPGSIKLSYETSRGCWYGKCTFCAINGKNNSYREKSSGKIVNDLKELIQRHNNCAILMTDSIMPPHFFDSLFPQISKEIPSVHIHYEIKANLTLEQLISLKETGVITIVPGIESLSSSLLRRMRKGVTARENIALLRFARSVQLSLRWFLLFGFPGDEVEEYEEMLRLLPLIHHLPPPRLMFPLLIYRFSQYQKFPEAFAISNLRPAEFYKDIFPLFAQLDKLAYYFTGDFPTQSYENPGIIIALAKEIQAWKQAWEAFEMVPLQMMLPTLHITRKSDDKYVLEDSRGLPGRPGRMVLNREQASILLVPRPQESPGDYQWALDAQLGVLMDSWFIPLATADPVLLLEFERDHESGD
ncbi:MAG: RiPP maturation radical SAM C-methyltransferase [Candidatus Aminicenantes bacterium]|nr:MAG: RiPP maturation radical SAM C-methyltransferase [Candidatus Aminicenantes bacterium]